jgi:hypothetical protein
MARLPLNNGVADALCSVITLGFAREMQQVGNPMVFEYDVESDQPIYEMVQAIFASLNTVIHISKSPKQTIMPYILGTNLPAQNRQTFIDSLVRWCNDVSSMMNSANQMGKNAPRGAYIGGKFNVNGAGNIVGYPDLVGPSALEQYMPTYRVICGTCKTIKDSYDTAVKHTNNAVYAVLEGNRIIEKRFSFDEPYKCGYLFGSCHGMIRAMALFPPVPQQDTVYVELALGDNTTKVSSCVPCSIFMSSFGKPASSIHLGRGDNWNMPQEITKVVKDQWRNYVVNYYLTGIESFNPLVLYNNHQCSLGEFISQHICRTSGDIEEIPDIFLEALTFESSFTDRIINTSTRAGGGGINAVTL